MPQRTSSVMRIDNPPQQAPLQAVDLRIDEKLWGSEGSVGLRCGDYLFKVYRRFLQDRVPLFVATYCSTEDHPPHPSAGRSASIESDPPGTSGGELKRKKQKQKKRDKVKRFFTGKDKEGGSAGVSDTSSMTLVAGLELQPAAEESHRTPLEIDDVRVYLVEDETPEDLQHFLWALVKPDTFNEKVDYNNLCAVLDLGTKYGAQELREAAINHIHSSYPPTLDEFMKRDETRTLPSVPGGLFTLLARNAAWRRQASKEEGRVKRNPFLIPPILLPTLYYCCTTHPVEELLDGVKYEGGVARLASEDMRRCLIAHSMIVEKQIDLYEFCREEQVKGCLNTTRRPRNTGRQSKISNPQSDNPCTWGRLQALCERSPNDPFLFDDDEDWWEAFENSVCEACLERATTVFEQARQDAWQELPSILGLGDWNALAVESDANDDCEGDVEEVEDGMEAGRA